VDEVVAKTPSMKLVGGIRFDNKALAVALLQ